MENQPTHRISRTAAILMAAAAAMPLVTDVNAQSGIAAREMARRQQAVQDSEAALFAGREAYAKRDFETAVAEYRRALDLLPDAPATQARRDEYVAHLSDGSVALAQKYRKVGKYNEARDLLENVLSPDVSPHSHQAKQELEYLDDPIRTNPALSYEHTKNVDLVRRALYKGEGFYNLGDFDGAEREFRNVLRVDPYNKAARRWLERTAATKSDYYRSAYDETRARLLMEVDKAWELAVPPSDVEVSSLGPIGQQEAVGASISAKLKSINIPQVDFEETTVLEAVEFLRQRSQELDTTSVDPANRGLNIIVASSSDEGGDIGSKIIPELRLRNVPLEFVLQSIVDITKLKFKVDEYSVRIVPLSEETESFITRSYSIPPDFRAQLSAGAGGGGNAADDDPFAEPSGGSGLSGRAKVSELLGAKGVDFPDGTSASIVGNSLIVRNTSANLDLVDELIQGMRSTTPKQIKILTKFVEINQENGEELGFDWVLGNTGQTNVGSFFVGGGTQGNASPARSGVELDPLNLGVSSALGNIVTAGNRSGDGAISGNSIDAILNQPTRAAEISAPAPGILSIGGIFNGTQISMLMRGLSQKRGVDIMTAPSIMARTNEKASIEIIREFIYPTEYEPPEVPDEAFTAVVTPATPTSFETRNTGVTLEIEPILGGNDYVIDLNFVPEIVEFEGFINYGSPISAPVVTNSLTTGGILTSEVAGSILLTDNRIEMPVFATRKVQTSITMYDGHTIAVGGLMREDTQNVEDKVPILGDIPYVGRLFKTKAERSIKSNLIIFVTARVIDATGRPIRGTDLFGQADSSVGGPGVLPTLQ